METNELIRHLAEDAGPVRRLASPGGRTLAWLAISLPYVAIVVLIMSPRPDLAAAFADPRFVIEQAAAIATAIAAAIAAFALTVPGISRRWMLLPLAPLTVWLGSLGLGCLNDWLQFGADGLRLLPTHKPWYGAALVCLPGIALVGALPAIAIVVMLRRGAPLLPNLTIALAGLAAAALGNFGLRLFHSLDASLMVLVWQFGSVALLALIAGSFGHRVLVWRHRLTG